MVFLFDFNFESLMNKNNGVKSITSSSTGDHLEPDRSSLWNKNVREIKKKLGKKIVGFLT